MAVCLNFVPVGRFASITWNYIMISELPTYLSNSVTSNSKCKSKVNQLINYLVMNISSFPSAHIEREDPRGSGTELQNSWIHQLPL